MYKWRDQRIISLWHKKAVGCEEVMVKLLGVICALLLGCVAIAWAEGGAPKLPNPSGPFGIGRVGYDWIDPTRPDRYSANPQAHRELMVYLWYPTSRKQADVRGAYLPGAKQFDAEPDVQRRMRGEFEANWPLIVSGAIFSHAAERAPAAKNPRRFPVVIFSHGNGGTSFGYTSVIEELTSRGYVVAAIEHAESAAVVWFPDGRIIPFHEDSPPAGLSAAEKSKWIGHSIGVGINEGAGDVRFVLDRLTELNAGDARQFLLAGRLDLKRVAAMGHSMGAEFAARAGQLDARFEACIDLDGGMFPVAALPLESDGLTPPMKPPLLFLEGYHAEAQAGRPHGRNVMAGTHEEVVEFLKKREEQLQTCPRGSYAVVLKSEGMVHGSFSDDPLLAAGDRGPEVKVAMHNLDLIEAFIRAFLDKNLKHAKAPLLDGGDSPLPEASVQRYGR